MANYTRKTPKAPTVAVQASKQDLNRFKALAKLNGYTVQGYFGLLVRKAINEAGGFDGNTSSRP